MADDVTEVSYRSEVLKEGDVYVAVCPDLNVSSFGDTGEDAGHSLQEAVEAFLELCQEIGTFEEVLEEAGLAVEFVE